MTDLKFQTMPISIKDSIANDIPSGDTFTYFSSTLEIPKEQPPMYVMCKITYQDSQIPNNEYLQEWYFFWGGMKPGKVNIDFKHARIEEKKKMQTYLKTNLKDW